MTVMVPPSFRIQRRILQARNDNSMDSIKKRIWGKKLWAQSRALPLAQGNIAVNFISEDSHPSEREKVWSEKCSRSVSNTTSWSFCKNLWILPLGGLEHVLAKLLQPRKTLQLLPNNVKQRWEYVISITDKTLQWNPWNWGTMLWETIGSYRTASHPMKSPKKHSLIDSESTASQRFIQNLKQSWGPLIDAWQIWAEQSSSQVSRSGNSSRAVFFSLLNNFVNASASTNSIEKEVTATSPALAISLEKLYQILICLVLGWATSLWAILMAGWVFWNQDH